MSLSKNAQKEMLKMNCQAAFPFLIEITRFLDDETSEVYRYANCDKDIVFEENTYSAAYFKISPPEKKSDGFSDAKLELSALDGEWIEKIRNTQKRGKIKFSAVIVHEDDGTENVEAIEDEEFELTSVSWSEDLISWTMKFDEKMDIEIPLEEVDIRLCPALA